MEPPSLTSRQPNDWTPYHNQMEFETMSAGDINKLMHLWGLGLTHHGDAPPFVDHWDLYSTIDKTPIGDIPWQSFLMKYSADDDPNSNLTLWMDMTYTMWFCDPCTIIHNMLGNPNFKNEIDYAPYWEWKGTGDSATCQWCNMMSGDWAWDQAVNNIAKDPATYGSTFVPVILRSDKTTVSVVTGQNDYYLLYASIGNVHNNVCHAHYNTVAFKKQLFHSLLSRILSLLKPAMSIPEVVQFSNGHFRCVLYGLSPYIANYPEQLILGCVIKNWCAKYQVTKGSFKDHFMALVEQYLEKEHGKASTAPPFTGLCRFPQGHGFLQWTGNNSKVLMKVYLPAIEGHIPQDIIRCFWAFLEFCYIMQQDIIAEDTLLQLSNCLEHFHQYWQISQDTGIQFDGFSLPCQHALCHYSMLIHLFGAPNGICSSITE
ncbi:hypothetical protein BDR06DRAFT_983099 [Suillus hirtellus]|nr:hypothetical protein BDR06DRAFT_983099 [Suillus hirtellus]